MFCARVGKQRTATSPGSFFGSSSLLRLSLSFFRSYAAHSSATVEGFFSLARCRKICLSDSLVPAAGGLT